MRGQGFDGQRVDLAPDPLPERAVDELVARHAAKPFELLTDDERGEMRLVGGLDSDLGIAHRGANQLSDLGGVHAFFGRSFREAWRASYITAAARYHEGDAQGCRQHA